MKRDIRLYLQDILDCITSIEKFTRKLSATDFQEDDKTASAVVWKLEVMGEAAKHLPESYRKLHKNMPWTEMARMRDKMIHFYFGIDYDIVWNVVTKRLPGLKKEVKQLLKEFSKS